MTGLVERAADRLADFYTGEGGSTEAARAALLAALDPEDEALVEAVMDALDTDDRFGARAAIVALHALAQGEAK